MYRLCEMHLNQTAWRTAGQKRLSRLKVTANRVVAVLLKQEAKGTVQRKDVLAMHSRTTPMSSKARKCTFLQAFPLVCVYKVTLCGSLKLPPETGLDSFQALVF